MTIIVEILESVMEKDLDRNDSINWVVNKSKTIEFTLGDETTNITNAKEKLLQLSQSLPKNQKLRVLNYHNGESDKTRQPCKILFEG